MRTRITIEHIVSPADDLLNTSEVWGDYVANVRCEAKIEGGSEGAVDKQNTARNVWTFKSHWTPKLGATTPLMRAKLVDGKTLPIKSAINEGQLNRAMIITCEETT